MDTPIFIDVEASGLDVESYPIEIALSFNGSINSWLIKPESNWTHWDVNAQVLHGLSRDVLMSQGLCAESVADKINKLLASTNGLVYSDAARWDSDWVSTLFQAVQIPMHFHILPIQDLLSDQQQIEFFDCLESLFERDHRRRHRAATDVELIAKAYSIINQ